MNRTTVALLLSLFLCGCITRPHLHADKHLDEAGNFIGSRQYYIDRSGNEVLHGSVYYKNSDGFLVRDDYEDGKKTKSWFVGLTTTPKPEEQK